MKQSLNAAACAAAMLALAGCAYYVAPDGTVVPAGYPVAAPASYDRSFAAAGAAMSDQGIAITQQDPAKGLIVGRTGTATVTANVNRQADGSVRVQFDARDNSDAGLLERVSRSYDRRMGR
jgi:hypothetical protein